MNDNEKLSNYIDRLNNEKKPMEHGSEKETAEMDELFETVRLVRSLKEVNIPKDNYSDRLTRNIIKKLIKEKDLSRPRKKWFYGVAAAAVIALIITLNTIQPFNKSNIVHAMEQAYKGIKAYHGVLEVIETNADGISTSISKVEVYADKEGHYYAKELEGKQKDLITVNDGQRKWQVQPTQKEIEIFPAFPDAYSFSFEIGKEINDVKDAIQTKIVRDDTIIGRAATVIEVTPKGGSPYKIWIDKETKMPLQKQSATEYALQYKVQYLSVDFTDTIPKELLTYKLPTGFKEINLNPEQVVNSFEEAKEIVGFTPKLLQSTPSSYFLNNIAVVNNIKSIKFNYTSSDSKNSISVLQKKLEDEFKPASRAILGDINGNIAEVQCPIIDKEGVLKGIGANSGDSGVNSIRWQQEGIEYAVIGNVSLEELTLFIKNITNETVELLPSKVQTIGKPQIEVKYDLKVEEGDQKNADAGHSPWKLDPVFVAQVFASLKLSPAGIQGDYPIKYEELKTIYNSGKEAVVEVGGNKTIIKRVYLKRLIRQDNTGIWTVVGYDKL